MPDQSFSTPVIEGEVIGVEGTVISTKWQHHPKYGSTHKMLIEVVTDEGAYRLYGSIPKSLGEPVAGQMVSMICTVVRSPEDPYWGWFKRARAAVYIE